MTIVLVNAKESEVLPGEWVALDEALKIPQEGLTFIETEPNSPERHLEDCRGIGEGVPIMVLLPTNFDPALPSEALKHFRHIQICGTDVRELCGVSPALQYKPFEP